MVTWAPCGQGRRPKFAPTDLTIGSPCLIGHMVSDLCPWAGAKPQPFSPEPNEIQV
jgi:hypothetical protein